MTLNVSYPGVYLSETGTSTISIQNGQAIVPLFINQGAYHPVDKGILCFNSVEELNTRYGVHTGYIYYHSIYSWFKLGGGKCYLALTDDIKKAVQQHDEINLIVTAGFAGNPQVKGAIASQASIISAVNNLADSGKPIFALLDGPQLKIATSDSPTEVMNDFTATSHAAVFYPWCQLKSPFPGDPDTYPTIPASVVAALAIAKTDSTRGAWKAPCNVPVSGITPNYPVTDELQG
ncbi:hypothetical protein VU661_22860, partial [Enterobacter kobei]